MTAALLMAALVLMMATEPLPVACGVAILVCLAWFETRRRP